LVYLYVVDLTTRGSVTVKIKYEYFSSLQNVQTGSEAHTASYSMETGVKRPEQEVDYSLPSTLGVKSDWSYASTPPICLGGVEKENLIKPHVLITEELTSMSLGFRLRWQRV
jgi:hypothetical protein